MIVETIAWIAGVALMIWLYLALFRGGFWRVNQLLAAQFDEPSRWPAIAAVIPARDEAKTIAQAVGSIAGQDYPAKVTIVVVDDGSTDGTAEVAKAVASETGRIEVITGQQLPSGWTGKMWAVAQGIDRVAGLAPEAKYVLLTDADIEHAPNSLRRLVAKAEQENLDLVSLMVKLRTQKPWEKLLVPAFVFFFQKLFPFPWVNDPMKPHSAAAGGCMLVKRDALKRIDGVSSIRDRVIDDCALAATIKPGGAIWLGLAEDSRSLRGYDGLRGLWDMVARTAFIQLKNSYVLLFGTVLGMIVFYLSPPVAVLIGAWLADFRLFLIGLFSWILMAYLYTPSIRLYGEAQWRAILLPFAALFYTVMTLDSAWRTLRGRGAGWKGRSYGPSSSGPERQVGE